MRVLQGSWGVLPLLVAGGDGARVCWVEGWVGAWSKWRGRVVGMTLC